MSASVGCQLPLGKELKADVESPIFSDPTDHAYKPCGSGPRRQLCLVTLAQWTSVDNGGGSLGPAPSPPLRFRAHTGLEGPAQPCWTAEKR